ncbi:hypothetical protein GQX73_g8521 [Xylaria multiplex]|uniref:Uncharacterized protein n=1 Tax=Xylaria multiplex TaxID=323545 RepID=A0A7C8IVV1_9PEZI|nr:hypothetical protein GQX73_g8521 [Xylaria multiplex]
MAKWKELGEVPDSDDESTWDSQESAPAAAQADIVKDATKDAGNTGDVDPTGNIIDNESHTIWDVPFSSQISAEEHNVLPSPKPKKNESQPPTSGSLINEIQHEPSPPLSSLFELGHRVESNTPTNGPVGEDRARSEELALSSPLDAPEYFVGARFEIQGTPLVRESERAENENIRLSRSLRPRKPIQEHPYLLESAQYNKTWKSHGLRPVRVLAEEEQKRRQEEDSQEKDFEDDSQVTNKDATAEESEESQTTEHFAPLPEVDNLLLLDDEEPSPTPEPYSARPEQAIPSSQEDDEFPDPNDVEKWKSNKPAQRIRKRQSSPKSSSKRKLPKFRDEFENVTDNTPILPDIGNIFDIPVSPPQTSPDVLAITPLATVNRLRSKPMITLTPKASSNVSSRIHSPAPVNRHSELIDLTALENGDSDIGSDGDGENDDIDTGSRTTSESEPDQVRLGARRIRGVLPASWLRLDQRASAQKAKPTARHRSPALSPDHSTKKGVAQRRFLSSQAGSRSTLFLDDSDDSDSTIRPQEPDISFCDINSLPAEDDAVSVIEEDHIDHMLSYNKRATTSSSGLQRKRKRGQQSIFNGQPGQRKRQQHITGLLTRTKPVSSTQDRRLQVLKERTGAQWLRKQNSGKRKPTASRPPRLGILDVVEPDAPAFIRIAARTASRRRDQGRSSPSKKVIMLGTRRDTIDAVGVLKRWNEGMIQPRKSGSPSALPRPRQAKGIKIIAQTNVVQNPRPPKNQGILVKTSNRFSQPRRMVKQANVSAPRYTHANDPLPPDLNPPAVVLDISNNEATGKLLGLAPYGTHYTQHFEIFPLDRGVFFHESTIIGNGRLKMALDGKSLGNLDNHRGRCMFTIDEQSLHWGPWDARISSELGIMFDWVMDHLDAAPAIGSEAETTTPVRAADFILVYLQEHLTFIEPQSSNTFASRLVNILQTFERRLQEIPGSRNATQTFIEVLTRVLIITVQVLRLCQKLNNISEAFQMEEILKRLAVTTAGVLLIDLKDVRDMYGHLQQSSIREKGIRSNEYSIICWVTLIRILEEVRLPRAGFWEVISSTVLGPSIDGTVDATILERAWRTLFTLLPLGEFDNIGVAIPGMRLTAPIEGWTIPQRLLRRIFQLYQNSSRQAPSFNDYLRANVSRCHYLVEQWGWHKCSTILGTIFDFFAAQDLYNLRNEEVYESPRFLEELSGSPSLATSPDDRCFHIYLKLIAMSIKRLQKSGMAKEVRNLVARLLPNHSRQYDKMMATHEAEIAALRNHHDLLCTLFWAAPPDMRPSIQSIEGLVVLGSSHKEACLINLRAWSRLSQFVVSSCEDISMYKPLADWQRNISQQVLEQFLSVEAEVNQQLLGMSAEACRNITQQHKNAVINKNKKVAMDILHFSMKAFIDIMHHTRTLGAASFVLNHYPLEQILTRLPFSSVDSDWGVLRVALDILDYFLTRIDNFTSVEPLHVEQSWHEEDAIMLLERRFFSPLMSVVRGVISIKSQNVGVGQVGDRDICSEQAVILAGRLGACLVHARLARFRQFFQAGKYNLFPDISKPTTSTTRKYVALFLATMADRGVADFKDLGLTPLSLFLVEITKPFEYLAYENRLAMSFKRLDETYLENISIKVGNKPDYSSNRDLFNHTIISMRKAFLRTDVSKKPHLQSIFSKALRFVMDRMRAEFKTMVLNSPEHLNYVNFVRSIISLIRSQDLCPVDSFFYQISQEYSPSREDPRLQTAGILSWGLKLEEGDSKAISGLFYLLFPSFKIALANGELANEAGILKESMKHTNVFNFMLSTMVPAIVRTATQASEGWVLLDTYIEALDARLSAPCIHRQIGGDLMMDILALHTIVLTGAEVLQTRAPSGLQHGDIITLTAMFKILNILSPSVTAYLINEPEIRIAKDFPRVIDELTDFTRAADTHLSDTAVRYDEQDTVILELDQLFDGLGMPGPETTLRYHEQVDRFSSHMLQDIRNNWVANEASITIKGPPRSQKPLATQPGQGAPAPKWETRVLLQNLKKQIRTWNQAHGTMMRTASHKALFDEILF